MKKIHKNATQTTIKQSINASPNADFTTILPKLLKLFPNFDFSKIINSLFSSQDQNFSNNQQKTIFKPHKQTLNEKAYDAFLEEHQTHLKDIKQKIGFHSL